MLKVHEAGLAFAKEHNFPKATKNMVLHTPMVGLHDPALIEEFFAGPGTNERFFSNFLRK